MDQKRRPDSRYKLLNPRGAGGDFAAAQDFLARGLTIRREIDGRWGLAASLSNLSIGSVWESDERGLEE